MFSTYTLNQKGAIITILAATLWGHLVLVLWTSFKLDTRLIEILDISAWILVVLYAIRFKWSYIVGIVGAIYVLFIALFFDFAYPSIWRWMITHPAVFLNFGFLSIVLHLIAIACIYFSYKSYIEPP